MISPIRFKWNNESVFKIILFFENYLPLGGLDEADYRACAGGLAAARFAYKTEGFARAD